MSARVLFECPPPRGWGEGSLCLRSKKYFNIRLLHHVCPFLTFFVIKSGEDAEEKKTLLIYIYIIYIYIWFLRFYETEQARARCHDKLRKPLRNYLHPNPNPPEFHQPSAPEPAGTLSANPPEPHQPPAATLRNSISHFPPTSSAFCPGPSTTLSAICTGTLHNLSHQSALSPEPHRPSLNLTRQKNIGWQRPNV